MPSSTETIYGHLCTSCSFSGLTIGSCRHSDLQRIYYAKSRSSDKAGTGKRLRNFMKSFRRRDPLPRRYAFVIISDSNQIFTNVFFL